MSDEKEMLKNKLTSSPGSVGRLEMSKEDEAIGFWLSAALDDNNVCMEMKADIRRWMNAKEQELIHGNFVLAYPGCPSEWVVKPEDLPSTGVIVAREMLKRLDGYWGVHFFTWLAELEQHVLEEKSLKELIEIYDRERQGIFKEKDHE